MLLFIACARTPEPVDPPPPPPPPTDARITFAVAPQDAALLVDGEEVGPVLRLPAGTHDVVARRQGYAEAERIIEVVAGEDIEVVLTLEPLPFAVQLAAVPEASQFTLRRGETVLAEGTLPWSDEAIPAGPLVLEVSHEGYGAETHEVFLDEPWSTTVWLDPPDQTVDLVWMARSGGQPKGLEIAEKRGEIWVAGLSGNPSVAVHDLDTGQRLHSVRLDNHGAVEVVLDKDEARAWFSQMETARVYELDTASANILRKMSTRSVWSKVLALSDDERFLYVSNYTHADISRISLDSGEVDILRTVDIPRGMFLYGDHLYVAGFDHGELEHIDLRTKERAIVFDEGATLRHIAGDATAGKLYISDMRAKTIWVHDIEAGTTEALCETDVNPNTIDLTPDGRVLAVSTRGPNGPGGYLTVGNAFGSIQLFDTRTGELLDAIVAGNQPTALDVSEDGKYLATSDFRDRRIRLYRLPDTATLLNKAPGRGPTYGAELRKR